MGKEKETVLRVVLDTNVLISALVFKGELASLVELWKNGRIRPLFSRETFGEFRKALDYPKFQLGKDEINAIIRDEVLPYFDVIEKVQGRTGFCRDSEDDKFIDLALSAKPAVIITGDKDILSLKGAIGVSLMKPADFLKKIK